MKTTKKLFSIFIALMMVLTIIPISAMPAFALSDWEAIFSLVNNTELLSEDGTLSFNDMLDMYDASSLDEFLDKCDYYDYNKNFPVFQILGESGNFNYYFDITLNTTNFDTPENIASAKIVKVEYYSTFYGGDDESNVFFPVTPAHTHNSNAYGSNATQHWTKCTDDEENNGTPVNHTWSNGKCTVCQYVCTHTGGTATCTAQAVCEVCGISYGQLASHSFTTKASSVMVSEATCTAAATYYVQCDNCTAVNLEKTVSAGNPASHSFTTKASSVMASEATCTAAATYYVQCDNCTAVNLEKTVSAGNPVEHSFTTKASSNKASDATCTEAATYYVQCDNCTAVDTVKTVAVGQSNGHSFTTKASSVMASEATCTEAATYYVQCDNCTSVNLEKTVSVGQSNGHSFTTKASSVMASEATCTTAATYYVQCDDCTAVNLEKTVAVGEASGHVEVTDEGYAATFMENGLTDGVHCDVCGEILVAQEVIPAEGHVICNDNINGFCKVYNEYFNVPVINVIFTYLHSFLHRLVSMF